MNTFLDIQVLFPPLSMFLSLCDMNKKKKILESTYTNLKFYKSHKHIKIYLL